MGRTNLRETQKEGVKSNMWQDWPWADGGLCPGRDKDIFLLEVGGKAS